MKAWGIWQPIGKTRRWWWWSWSWWAERSWRIRRRWSYYGKLISPFKGNQLWWPINSCSIFERRAICTAQFRQASELSNISHEGRVETWNQQLRTTTNFPQFIVPLEYETKISWWFLRLRTIDCPSKPLWSSKKLQWCWTRWSKPTGSLFHSLKGRRGDSYLLQC